MDYNDLYLPAEMLEHIINLIPDSADRQERWHSERKQTLLACALVCKTWTSIARRRLLSLYFPTGVIKIRRDLGEIFALADIFQSPFRTIDPAFIETLYFTAYLRLNPSSRVELCTAKAQSFRGALSTLDAATFRSLRTFEFDSGSRPPSDAGDDDDGLATPPLQVLSQIKTLVFRIFHCHLFGDVVHIIRLCPFVEEVTAFIADSSYRIMDPSLHQFHPPIYLRHLALDMQALLEVTDWMMGCQPNYTNISSLVVYDFSWHGYINSNYFRRFLDGVGPNLEKLVLDVPGPTGGAGITIHAPDIPLAQFTKNTSLKHFTLRTTQDVAIDVLPYLLGQTHFAPELRTLEIEIPCWKPHTTLHNMQLRLLDQRLRSRSVLHRIVLSCGWNKWPEYWGEVEDFTRQCLPYCEEKGLLEFSLLL